MKTYFKDIAEGITSLWHGLKLSLRHFINARKSRTPIGIADENYFAQETGIVTLKYPYEALPVPDNGRYRLHNEIDDCIVCDKCAEICPVDCIEIEAVRSPEEIRKTSDGHSVRLYAAKFDIDMAKCCFCGLCTTVCPTECLTMTKTYDFSEFNVAAMNYHFSDISPQQAEEKRQVYDEFQAAKQQAKADGQNAATENPGTETQNGTAQNSIPGKAETPALPAKPTVEKPVIKPVIKKDNPA